MKELHGRIKGQKFDINLKTISEHFNLPENSMSDLIDRPTVLGNLDFNNATEQKIAELTSKYFRQPQISTNTMDFNSL